MGFPDSVSPDYLAYQLWAVPSHITGWLGGSLITSSLLAAVGVKAGAGAAAGAAASIRWITKDGIGALGRLLVSFYPISHHYPDFMPPLVDSTGCILSQHHPGFLEHQINPKNMHNKDFRMCMTAPVKAWLELLAGKQRTQMLSLPDRPVT